jgi:hypothetical protein
LRYSSPPKSKPRTTGPSTGHVHAPAGAAAASDATKQAAIAVVIFVNIVAANLAGWTAVVKMVYSERR